MKKIHVFTSAASNYLPKVRVLCESLKRHHPEFVIHFALADRKPDWLDAAKEPFDDVIALDDLDIPNRTGWAFCHSIVELSTAIKPFVLQRLLAEPDCRAVLYFDPDIVLFSKLEDLVGEFERASILLTPHQTRPETDLDAVLDNEVCSLAYGVFNLGFLGIRNDEEGAAFARWWAERIYYFCIGDVQKHVFTDQKWGNFIPVFFNDVKILKSSRFNVATWNITTRELTGSFKQGFQVDGQPLGFYHFTGFDSGAHKVMAAKNAGGNGALQELIAWYRRQGDSEECRKIHREPWSFSRFDNGEPITKEHRLIYRMREDLQAAFPDPFKVIEGQTSYYDWFRWQAAAEHPEIAGPNKEKEQGPGFATIRIPFRRSRGTDWARFRRIVGRALTEGGEAQRLAMKAAEVYKTRGIQGIKEKLFGH